MAQRRMFSPQIVQSEEFLSMPTSSQALYFHLGMSADDDGFIQPKMIMRQIGSADDDLKVLLAKRFLLSFESGVVVVKHWLIHNLIQKDRYHPTRFQEEHKTLFLKENKAYTDNPESVNKMLPEVRLGKVKLLAAKAEEPIEEVTDIKDPKNTHEMLAFYTIFSHNPARFTFKGRVHEREATKVLLQEYGYEECKRRYRISQKHKSDPNCPQIDSPADMLGKMVKMETYLKNI